MRTIGNGATISRNGARALAVGDLWVDLAAEEIHRGGDLIRLEPRAWRVLTSLLARPGEVVSKDDLLTASWDEAYVSDAALSQAVLRIRRALDDSARAPRYIETVHRRGYRLVAAVQPAATTAAADARLSLLAGADGGPPIDSIPSPCRHSPACRYPEPSGCRIVRRALAPKQAKVVWSTLRRTSTAALRGRRGRSASRQLVWRALRPHARCDR